MEICRQSGINEPNVGGTVEFQFKIPYKLQVVAERNTLGILRIELLGSQAHMNNENFEALLASLVFEMFPKETQELLHSIMSMLAEAMDTEAMIAKGVVPEVAREVEGVVPEVSKVLVEVRKSPWMPRPKLTQTKESEKDKKGKQAVIPVCTSPRANPSKDKPTAQDKGKAINLELEEEEIEDISMDDEWLSMEMEDVEVEGSDPITKLP